MAEVKTEPGVKTEPKEDVVEIDCGNDEPPVSVKVEEISEVPALPRVSISGLAAYQPGKRRLIPRTKILVCKACGARFNNPRDLSKHHATHSDTMERPMLNKAFRMQGVLKHGPRKRQRPGEDEFDMVLNNAEDVTPSVITQKLPPIPLESIPQSERLSLLSIEAKNDHERIKTYFREKYPAHAGRWDHDDNWLECPIQIKTVQRWRIRIESENGQLQNAKSMMKRKQSALAPEYIESREHFRRVAMEVFKEKGMVLTREIKRRMPEMTKNKIYLRFRQIGWKSFNGMYGPPTWEQENGEKGNEFENYDEGAIVEEEGVKVENIKMENEYEEI